MNSNHLHPSRLDSENRIRRFAALLYFHYGRFGQAQMGLTLKRRSRRIIHDGRSIFAGNLVALANNCGKKRKLVLIMKVNYATNFGAISASLDKYPFFSQAPAWHAARVHHACRVLDPPEAPCEHVGSLLHAGWNPAQGLAPRPLVDAALLKLFGRKLKVFLCLLQHSEVLTYIFLCERLSSSSSLSL